MNRVILASTSTYRRALLERIGLRPECIAPLADEKTIAEDFGSGIEVAEARALLKTKSVSQSLGAGSASIIIGGDQLVHMDGQIFGKPGDFENARQMLKTFSGKTHELITSICVIGIDQNPWIHTDTTQIKFHSLNEEEIRSYLLRDKPFDCAGSYKIEALGPWLIESIRTDDSSAIEGIPLLALTRKLRKSQNISTFFGV